MHRATPTRRTREATSTEEVPLAPLSAPFAVAALLALRAARRARRVPPTRRAELLEDQRALPARHGTPEFQAELRQKRLASEARDVRRSSPPTPSGSMLGNLCVAPQRRLRRRRALLRLGQGEPRQRPPRPDAVDRPHAARPSPATSGPTRSGPRASPGVVITNGSVQAPEELYWAFAAALAKAGYVVLTWDPQTQGRSDGPGEPPTRTELHAADAERVHRGHARRARLLALHARPPRSGRATRLDV